MSFNYGILTARASYRGDEPTQGFHRMLAEARRLGAQVRLDSDDGAIRIQLTLAGSREQSDLVSIAGELRELSDALPPGEFEQSSSWRLSGPPPF